MPLAGHHAVPELRESADGRCGGKDYWGVSADFVDAEKVRTFVFM